MGLLTRPRVWIASVIALLIAVYVIQFGRSMTYEGDRDRSGASDELLRMEKSYRKTLESSGNLVLGPVSNVEYLFIPVPGPIRLIVSDLVGPDFSIDSVIGPMQADIDSDWHIIIVDHGQKKVKVVGFPMLRFGMINEFDRRVRRGSRLRLSLNRSKRSTYSPEAPLLIVEALQ